MLLVIRGRLGDLHVVRLLPCWGPIRGGVLALAENCPLEVLEGYHYYRHVVEGLSVEGVLEHALHCEAALLVHILCELLVLVVDVDTVPYALGYVFV
jgi:hypothetical protein